MKSSTHRWGWLIFATYLVISLGAVPAFAQAQDEDPWVCPPCGHDCLKTTFDDPGACGECGMTLMKLSVVINERPDAAHDPGLGGQKVAILLFEGVEIIDYTGPWEIFGNSGFEVFSVTVKPGPIRTAFGMTVTPDYTLEDHPKPDIVVIPGGAVFKVQNDPEVRKWLQEKAVEAEVVLSVCNGAFILAKAGLLDGLKATTTRHLIDGLANAGEDITVVHGVRFVDNGKIVTSGGLSAGMDAALHVVSRFNGMEYAQNIAVGLEYDWRRDGDAGE